MDAEPRGPREPSSKRPGEAEIHAVLDGAITGERASEVRRLVASDPELRRRFGPLFEVELFGGPGERASDESTAAATILEPTSKGRTSRLVAGLATMATLAAAALVVAILSRRPVAPDADREPDPGIDRIADSGPAWPDTDTDTGTDAGSNALADSSAIAGSRPNGSDSVEGSGPVLLAARVTRVEHSATGTVAESWVRDRLGHVRRIRVERDSTGKVGLTTRTYELVGR